MQKNNPVTTYTIIIFSVAAILNAMIIITALAECYDLLYFFPGKNDTLFYLIITCIFYCCISLLMFLLWYHSINKRYYETHHKHASLFRSLYLLDWLIPFVNIFLPIITLNRIMKGYSNDTNKKQIQNNTKLIYSWVVIFIVGYLTLYFSLTYTPDFKEDTILYHELHPLRALVLDLLYPCVNFLELLSMNFIIIQINKLEMPFHQEIDNVDIMEHLIEY